MKHVDIAMHVRGESRFVDDEPAPEGLLHAAVFTSPVSHGKIRSLDVRRTRDMAGVHGVFTAADIPGENQIGNIIQDEPLLAEDYVHFIGQPVALVVAETPEIARAAAQSIDIDIEELPAIFDAREAFAKGELIAPPRTFSLGDTHAAWKKCEHIIEGRVDSGGQEHVYLETQASLAVPEEDRGIKLLSATQSLSMVQKIVARILALPMHKVEVDTLRLGGAFGGKEDQATAWAGLAALAAFKLDRPVKLVLRRDEDMRMTGKRHPYSSDFKIGLAKDGAILAWEAQIFQNAGAAADLSTAILERTLFHVTNSYFIPNVKVTAASCRTNLPPNTAFRGFGGPQAMFLIESAIFKAAAEMGLDPAVIQQKNLLDEGDQFPYGMRAKNCHARPCWDGVEKKYDVKKRRTEIEQFNREHEWRKKGLAMMPICFGISFTSTFLNQASALVHIYQDGTVSVSTAAVEMGQGVKTKIAGIAARVFSIDPQRVRVESSNTRRVANMSPTAASSGADMNGHATRLACEDILARLKQRAAKHFDIDDPQAIDIRDETVFLRDEKTDLHWDELITLTYMDRKSLSAQAHYATPKIYFDKSKEKGEPFAYHVFGAAAVEATVDCLRGAYEIDSVKLVHDVGESLNPHVDRGQIEGGVVQGLGWMTIEELMHSDNGKLLTDSLTTYKVPDIYSAPDIKVHFLQDSKNPPGPFYSKAIGEPPFMYGIGAYFAILRAMKAFRKDVRLEFHSPMTPEKVLLAIYDG
ncbi:MAG: molybdopterin-dependent oxidoreductase [Actinobacteria bacterium]|nr:molybdopterin-dependent oxidoreductase [Actinomycetota bacterium]